MNNKKIMNLKKMKKRSKPGTLRPKSSSVGRKSDSGSDTGEKSVTNQTDFSHKAILADSPTGLNTSTTPTKRKLCAPSSEMQDSTVVETHDHIASPSTAKPPTRKYNINL